MSRLRLLLVPVLIFAAAVAVFGETKEEKQAKARKKADETLQKFYKKYASSQTAIKKSVGYAVFNNGGAKILLAGGGKGSGIAVDNTTKRVTYMKMREIQAGLGFGVKKFSVLFVFQTKKAFDNFIDGNWEFGGQTTAAAKTGGGGGSLEGAGVVSDGVWMYQLTDKGVALELTAKSTKYSRDDDLN